MDIPIFCLEFHLHISAEPETAASSFSGTVVALSDEAQIEFDQVPVDSRLYEVRLGFHAD